LTTQAKDDAIESVHGAIGFNYRLTNIQAALGVAQLEKLDVALESKRLTAEFYERALSTLPVARPRQSSSARSSWWLYTVLVHEAPGGVDRPGLMKALAAEQIETRPLWRPVSQQPPFADCQAYRCEVSPDLHRRSVSLPCSVGIAADDLARVAAVMKHVLSPNRVTA